MKMGTAKRKGLITEGMDIHCLKCDHIYLEGYVEVEICPNCGNTDMMQTVYLEEEIEWVIFTSFSVNHLVGI